MWTWYWSKHALMLNCFLIVWLCAKSRKWFIKNTQSEFITLWSVLMLRDARHIFCLVLECLYVAQLCQRGERFTLFSSLNPEMNSMLSASYTSWNLTVSTGSVTWGSTIPIWKTELFSFFLFFDIPSFHSEMWGPSLLLCFFSKAPRVCPFFFFFFVQSSPSSFFSFVSV